MRTYDVQCPFCGAWNRSLYLEETKGNMECDVCQRMAYVPRKQRFPAAVRKNAGNGE